MAHLHENEIEQYILEPAQMSAEKQSALFRHLSDCAQCQQVYRELKSFYQELDQTPDAGNIDLERFMSALYPKTSVLYLKPVSENAMRRTSPFKLSARSGEQKNSRFERIATFGSGDYAFMVRILRDHSRDKLLTYVIPEDDQQSGPYILHFPDFKRDLVTDTSGKAEMDDPANAFKEDKSLAIELHLPLAVFGVEYSGEHQLNAKPESPDAENYHLELQHSDKTIRLSVSGKTDNHRTPSRLMLIFAQQQPQLLYLKSGLTEIDKTLISSKPVSLRLFE